MNYSQLTTTLLANIAVRSDELLEFVFDTNSFDYEQIPEAMFEPPNIVDNKFLNICSPNQIANVSLAQPTAYKNQQKEFCYFEAATIWVDNYVVSLQHHYLYPKKDFHLRHSLTQLLVAIYYHLDSYDGFQQRADFFAQSFQSILNILRESQILESQLCSISPVSLYIGTAFYNLC